MLVRWVAVLHLIRRLLRRLLCRSIRCLIRMDWLDQAKSIKVSHRGAFSQSRDRRPAGPVIIIMCPCGHQQFGHTFSNEVKGVTCLVAEVARLARAWHEAVAPVKPLLTPYSLPQTLQGEGKLWSSIDTNDYEGEKAKLRERGSCPQTQSSH